MSPGIEIPPRCVRNMQNNNNQANSMNHKISVSNNRLKNATSTISTRPNQKRKKFEKTIKNNLKLSQTEGSVVASNNNFSARKHHQSNNITTNAYFNKVNHHHNKNQRNLVSNNNNHNNYNENGNKFIGATQPRHKFRHLHSRQQHARRSPNQKALEIEINP